MDSYSHWPYYYSYTIFHTLVLFVSFTRIIVVSTSQLVMVRYIHIKSSRVGHEINNWQHINTKVQVNSKHFVTRSTKYIMVHILLLFNS
jgi:hypothetical protein